MESVEYRQMRAYEDTHWWYDGLRRLWSRALKVYLPETDGIRIADIGCGTGANSAFAVREFSAKAVGADKSRQALQWASDRPECTLLQAEAENLPFQSESFNAALLMDVLYIQGIDERAALQEIYRILKPGGILLVNLPAFEFLRGKHDRAVHTRHRYTKKELAKSLNDEGFEILKISYWNFFLFPAIFIFRQLSRLSCGSSARSDVGKVFPVYNLAGKILLRAEFFLLFKTGLPWGVSLFAAARVRKPA